VNVSRLALHEPIRFTSLSLMIHFVLSVQKAAASASIPQNTAKYVSRHTFSMISNVYYRVLQDSSKRAPMKENVCEQVAATNTVTK
jgi:hypothetical protein